MSKPTTTRAEGRSRREFLRAGLAGMTTLSPPALFRLRAETGVAGAHAPTALIIVWLRGGCSHLDTYALRGEGEA